MAETTLAIAAVFGAAAAVGGTVMSVQSAQASAKAQRNAAQQAAALEMEQYQEERKAAALQAQQEAAAVLRQRDQAVATMVALRASRGLDPYGGSGRMLLDDTLEEAAADLETVGSNLNATFRQLGYGERATGLRTSNAIKSADLSGRAAATTAGISGVGSVASIGSNYANRYLSTSTTKPTTGNKPA